MTAFLKIDNCKACERALPWEFVPAVVVEGRTLAGTGVWRSQLIDRICPDCHRNEETNRERKERDLAKREALIELLGGVKPYREFMFEPYRVNPGNELAYKCAKDFNPASENLYLWGACGVGKTHLALAAARRCFVETISIRILRAGQMSRHVRMKDPEQEQAILDEWARAEMLVVDDLGGGTDTAFSRQLLQEVLDAREFRDQAGLFITSKYSLSDLARKFNDDSIPSRLAGMCRVIEIQGDDHRLRKREAQSIFRV